MRDVLRFLITAVMLAVMLRAVLSWFPPKGFVARAQAASRTLTNPVLRPLQRVLPAVGVGAFRLDLAPAVVLVVCQFVLLPLTA